MKTDVHNKLVDYKSLFWTPDYIEISAWIEHVPFAFYLIEILKPKSLVELGVHNGTSYFAFCQAIQSLNLNTVCYGVDTWKGDEHAGFYNEEVFAKVTTHNSNRFSGFSTLIRSTFDEATAYFTDGSIDLLHIDGLHTYEAVKHDFESWLPKLSPNAIVLFHDINVRERHFGVFKLWEELKHRYRGFQFDFGHGLGILAIGKVASPELKELLDTPEAGSFYTFLKNLFSDRGSKFKALLDTSLLLNEKTNQQKVLEQLTESNETLNKTNEALQLQYNELQEKYKDNLEEHSQQISRSKNNANKLSKQLQSQQQIISWYKATYEDRSAIRILLGKIKTGLNKIFFNPETQATNPPLKFLNMNYDSKPIVLLNDSLIYKNKQRRYHLHPVNEIKYHPETSEYRAEGTDPFFIIHFENRALKAGWYWLSINISEIKDKIFSPKLYYNIGRGFNERDVWNLPNISNGRIEGMVYLPSNVTDFRFDPSITKCIFKIRSFHLKRSSRINALRIAISGYKQNYFPDSTYLSFFGKLFSDFLKTGKPEFRKKLRAFIYQTDPQANSESYKNWCLLFDTVTESDIEKIKSLSASLSYQPLFSVVMPVYNAPISFLKKAIDSVRDQAYPNWELCIADDKSTNNKVSQLLKEYQAKDQRIKVIYRDTNGHICHASNSALELATGDYMVLLDQDDELRPHSLYQVASALNKNRDLALIYSDEDKIDENGNRFDPYFKTDWNIDLFYGQNMINHLGVYKLSLVKKIGGFRPGYEGSQDYDLALRCIEHLQPDQIHHIQHILYHWRAIKGSTAVTVGNKNYAYEAGLQALNDHFERTNQHAVTTENVNFSYRVKWPLPAQQPVVSIIIPTKDNVQVLSTCVESILQKTDYKNYEVLIIDNNSEEQATLEYFKHIVTVNNQIKVLPFNKEFNFSAIVNYGVQHSTGEVVVLMNNDTEVINESWLTEMTSQCLRKEIGVVGVKLFYPTGQIQHAGVFLYEGAPGNHIYLKRDKNDPGYFNKLNLVQNYCALTAACFAIRKELYLKAGGFDETNLKVAYNDVDFCLKVRELGYRNLFTPFAQLFHHESISRGSDLTEENFRRFKKEQSFMLTRWKSIMANDPYFNPNLHIDTTTTKFAYPPKIKYDWQN